MQPNYQETQKQKLDLKTVDFIGLFVVFCSIVSIFDERSYVSDLLSSFRFQYFLFLIVWYLHTLYNRKKYFGLGISFSIILNLYFLLPTWTVDKVIKTDFEIYFANVLSSNDKYDLIINDVLKKEPDLVVLQEVTEGWEKALSKLSKSYPYKVVVPREDNFGIAVYSSIEFKSYRTFLSSAGLESILVELKVSNEKITILTTHPLPPIGLDYWNSRNEQYDEIKDYFKDSTGEKILIGDLNTIPWSSYIQRIEKNNKMESINSFDDSWNTFFPPMFRIRTLFALASSSIKGEIRILDDIGSDHLPFLLKIKIHEDKL